MGKQQTARGNLTGSRPQLTSVSNPIVKRLRSLERKKARKETGLFLVEGARHLTEAMTHGWTVDTLVMSVEAAQRPGAQALIKLGEDQGARLSTCSEKVLSSISNRDNAQTIVGAVKKRERSVQDLRQSPGWGVVALYQPRDPGNLGTIIRTADMASLRGVVVVGEACDLYAPETVRASMGSLFACPVVFCDLDDLIDAKTEWGAALIGASVDGDGPETWPEARPGAEPVLFMGNEQAGLSPAAEDACDALIRLPMRPGADSLNLASASAVMIYEAWRRLGYPGAA